MGSEVIAAAVISSIVGAGSSMYAADEQRKAQEEAEKRAAEAREAAEREKIRIARETRPEAKSAEGIKYGIQDDNGTGSFEDFLVKKDTVQKTSGLKTTGLSGLGYV